MTALKEKKRPDVPLGDGPRRLGVPVQVNLLPPEVSAARGLRRIKVWLGIALVVVVVLIGAGYALAVVSHGLAVVRLADAQSETTRLRAEEATYAEVPRVLGEISDVRKAREVAMSTEVRWKPYVDAVTAVLPMGVSLDSYTVLAPSPSDVLPGRVDPLAGNAIGSITFSARSISVPDAAALIDALESVPGFADARVPSTTFVEGQEGADGYWQVTGSVQLTDDVFAHRFVTTAEPTDTQEQ